MIAHSQCCPVKRGVLTCTGSRTLSSNVKERLLEASEPARELDTGGRRGTGTGLSAGADCRTAQSLTFKGISLSNFPVNVALEEQVIDGFALEET